MRLATGERLGPYEIVDPIGTGGMGEVYKARDTRLGRLVAIKILKEEFSERFEREARTIAALNHPNVCQLYDLGPNYLVMEFVEGETVAAKINQRPLQIVEALRIAREVAEGLQAAHANAIVHRDVKSANVMVTSGGRVKLMDFGLASAQELLRMTQTGVALGTPAYMAPEQVRGAKADARSDIWGLGVVLYEMITGRLPFSNPGQAIAGHAVLYRDPEPVTALRSGIPIEIDRIVGKALEKDPAARYQHVEDLAVDLHAVERKLSEGTFRAAHTKRRGPLWAVAGGLLALLVVTALTAWVLKPAPRDRQLRLSIMPPAAGSFETSGETGGFALSPDETKLAFIHRSGGKTQLWIRSLDATEPRPLPGTEGAIHPFWSPDSGRIGFFASDKLKRIDAAGGPIQVVCDAPEARGGDWNEEGTIVFAGAGRPIHRVSSSGGAPVTVTRLDPKRGEDSHYWPRFLPGGKRFLFGVRSRNPQDSGIRVAPLDGSETTRLIAKPFTNASYVPIRSGLWPGSGSGYLVFAREETLMAQRFDPASLQLSGDELPIATPASRDQGTSRVNYSVRPGMLAYAPRSETLQRLVLRDPNGGELSTIGQPGDYTHGTLSDDGKRMVFRRASNLWIVEMANGSVTRFTFDGGAANPVWSPDGRDIAYSSTSGGAANIYRKASSGADTPQRLTVSQLRQFPRQWSPDGSLILYAEIGADSKWDLMAVPAAGGGKPYPVVQTPHSERFGRFSPDGRWIAYTSDESGRLEVYVRRFTPGQPAYGGPWQVSGSGGTTPVWGPSGKALYYRGMDGKLMIAAVTVDGPTFQRTATRALFDTSITGPDPRFEVLDDSHRFLLIEPILQADPEPLTLVTNWLGSLSK